jgi:hypothetical protein
LPDNDLSPLLLKFAVEYGIKKVQENQERLKLIETHQLLVYADDANPLGDNTRSSYVTCTVRHV